MSLFLRIVKHLLPQSPAWSLEIQRTLTDLVDGTLGTFQDARVFAENVWTEYFPATTGHIEEHERELGIYAAAADSEQDRRDRLAAYRRATGGQSLGYLQDLLHAAGFPTLYLHEWWRDDNPDLPRDPRYWSNVPLFGEAQCHAIADEYQVQCSTLDDSEGAPIYQWQCSNELVNDVRYLVNLDLTRRAPPPMPEDPLYWRYFIYIGGAELGPEGSPSLVNLPRTRKVELERLLLKHCPTKHWIVLGVNWTSSGVFDHTFDSSFE